MTRPSAQVLANEFGFEWPGTTGVTAVNVGKDAGENECITVTVKDEVTKANVLQAHPNGYKDIPLNIIVVPVADRVNTSQPSQGGVAAYLADTFLGDMAVLVLVLLPVFLAIAAICPGILSPSDRLIAASCLLGFLITGILYLAIFAGQMFKMPNTALVFLLAIICLVLNTPIVQLAQGAHWNFYRWTFGSIAGVIMFCLASALVSLRCQPKTKALAERV